MQLSNEKLIELIKDNIFPIDHMEKLYLQNKPLMVKIIKGMMGIISSDFMDELLQECYIILCNCLKSYDLKQGNKFSTYFSNAIRWGIYEYTLSTGTKIKIPINLLGKVRKYKKLYATGETESNIIKALNISTSELKSIKNIAQSSVISLDTPLKNLDNVTVGESIPDNNSNFEDDVINSADDKIFYNLVKSILPERHFKVVKMIYWQGMTLVNISKILGVTSQYIAQLRVDALRKLRNNIRIINYRNEYRNVGVKEFNRTRTSSTELAALKRVEVEELLSKLKPDKNNPRVEKISPRVEDEPLYQRFMMAKNSVYIPTK